MKNANLTFHESFLFQKKIKSLYKNEKITNHRKKPSSNNNKYKNEFLNKTQNLFYKEKNSLPSNNKLFRVNSVSRFENIHFIDKKILPRINKINGTNDLKNFPNSSKYFIKHNLKYLNLSDNLKINENKNEEKNNNGSDTDRIQNK